jgi:hypothetical protein
MEICGKETLCMYGGNDYQHYFNRLKKNPEGKKKTEKRKKTEKKVSRIVEKSSAAILLRCPSAAPPHLQHRDSSRKCRSFAQRLLAPQQTLV